jgi:hypothetical protein
MSLPYQIADAIDFTTAVGEGLDITKPVVESRDLIENTLDMLLRSDPSNPSDPADVTTWIYVGNINLQPFPLRANESVNLRITRRESIFFRAPLGHKLHVVCARLTNVG